MKKTFGQVDKIVENHFISSEGIWNHCSRLEGAHWFGVWQVLVSPTALCFGRHSKSMDSARLLSFGTKPQRAAQLLTKCMTEWQEGLDSKAAERYSLAQVQITFTVQVQVATLGKQLVLL